MQPLETNPSTTHRRRTGFTLVELLVVVSIIALLISILLPSLKSARNQAKMVACMSIQAGLGRGSATYQSEWNGWLPGSPGTSGSVLLGYPAPPPGDSHDTAGERLQTWDWATPLGIWKAYSRARGDRWKVAVEKLLCPNNQYLSEPFYSGAIGPRPGWPVQPMVSYDTIRQYMLWPWATRNSQPWGEPAPFPKATPEGTGLGGAGQWYTPRGYSPRIERVGNPSEHIFLSDGARFTDSATGRIDHDIDWNANAGGGFSDGGPTLPYTFLRAFHSSKNASQRRLAPITYRHTRGKSLGLIACYYDARAEYMTEAQSRWPDPWWPKDSEINASDFNTETQILCDQYFDGSGWYRVRR